MKLSDRAWLRGGIIAGMALWGGLQAAPAAAEAGVDCAAIRSGGLDVDLSLDAATRREAVLKRGDVLTIAFDAAAAGPFGTVTLSDGARERPLLVGPSGTRVTFKASKAGLYPLEFSKDGPEPASFKAECVPTRGSRPTAGAGRVPGRTLGLPAQPLENLEDAAVAELAGVVLDPRDVVQPRPVNELARASTLPQLAHPAAGPLDMTLQWRGEERYRLDGPDGLEIDRSRSGLDASVVFKPMPEIMVSALAQVDQPGETLIYTPHDFTQQGWMAGPATTIKLAPNVSLDARAAWGVVEYGSDPLSPHTATLPRRTVSAKLASTQSFGPWRFSPSLSVNHTLEETVVGAETQEPGAHMTGFGRVDLAPEIAYRIDLDRSLFIEPRALVGGFWTTDSLSRLAPTHSHGDMRFKAEAGVTVGAGNGTKLQATGTVEEGEPGAADVWTGRLQLSVPMK